MFEISHGSFLRQPLFRHLMTRLQRNIIFLQKLCFSCPWLANSLMPSYFSCQWFFDAEFLNLRVNIDMFGLRVGAVAHIQSLTVIDVRGVLNVYCARFDCTYALMSSIHWFNCTEGSLRWKISKGLKKEDECSCPGIWKTFSLLSHTHTPKYVETIFKSGLKWVPGGWNVNVDRWINSALSGFQKSCSVILLRWAEIIFEPVGSYNSCHQPSKVLCNFSGSHI